MPSLIYDQPLRWMNSTWRLFVVTKSEKQKSLIFATNLIFAWLNSTGEFKWHSFLLIVKKENLQKYQVLLLINTQTADYVNNNNNNIKL